MCDKGTGHCPTGCQSHWTGDKCDGRFNIMMRIIQLLVSYVTIFNDIGVVSVCADHFYGKECNNMCGHCKDNSVCDKGTGSCPNGCQAQWTGAKCDGRFLDLC